MSEYSDICKQNAAIIRAMLKDDEFMAGGIFSKEKDYMRRYGMSYEEIYDMQTLLYKAVTTNYGA